MARGVRLVLETGRPVSQIAGDLGIGEEALRKRVYRAKVDARGGGKELSSPEREELVALRREVTELRRANEILKDASVFFAKELDPYRPR